MTSPEPIALPAVEVVEFSDPTISNIGIELIKQDAVALDSKPLRVRRIIVRLGGAAVVMHSASQRVRAHTSMRPDLCAYAVFGPTSRGTMNGLPVGPGVMIVAEGGAEARLVVEAGWQAIAVMVSPQVLRQHLIARECSGEFRAPRGVETLKVAAEKIGELYGWGKRLVETAARQPELFNELPDLCAAAEAELFETLIATLRRTDEPDTNRSDRKRQSYSLMVKYVEEYALAHVGDHLLVTDLCKAAAVSERTLENAFKEILGITPVAYLIRLRLHRTRQALLAGSVGSTTVTSIALNWGFWHFGEFSRAYKQCFGELPSDTLRRTADINTAAPSPRILPIQVTQVG